jgi:hypothetical protein
MEKQNLVEKFNEQFPVGSSVRWRSIASDKAAYREYTVHAAARLQHGQPVTWFVEKSGMVSIEPQFVDYGSNLNQKAVA